MGPTSSSASSSWRRPRRLSRRPRWRATRSGKRHGRRASAKGRCASRRANGPGCRKSVPVLRSGCKRSSGAWPRGMWGTTLSVTMPSGRSSRASSRWHWRPRRWQRAPIAPRRWWVRRRSRRRHCRPGKSTSSSSRRRSKHRGSPSRSFRRHEIVALASGFLSDLTDARYDEVDLDEDYRVVVLDEGVPKPVISGGEEDIANLVLRLAISQMIAERAGQPLSLLVLDEIFGSLDESRRQHVLALLRRLGDRFPQVILITHIEQVRDGLDRIIRVSYDATTGTSVVRDETATLGPTGGAPDESVAA